MRYVWDAFRWRLFAAFMILLWACKGFSLKGQPKGMTRWQVAKWSWECNRSAIMYRHEKHKYRSAKDIIAELREQSR